MAENVTAQQQVLRRSLIEQQKQINDIFAELQIRKQDLHQNHHLDQNQDNHVQEPLAYLSKYEKFKVEKVKKNYEDAWPMFKWLELPFCKRMIIDELRFSIPANICLALGFFTLNKNNKRILEFNVKNFAKVYTGITLFTTLAIVGYNMIFEPYWYPFCNIAILTHIIIISLYPTKTWPNYSLNNITLMRTQSKSLNLKNDLLFYCIYHEISHSFQRQSSVDELLIVFANIYSSRVLRLVIFFDHNQPYFMVFCKILLLLNLNSKELTIKLFCKEENSSSNQKIEVRYQNVPFNKNQLLVQNNLKVVVN